MTRYRYVLDVAERELLTVLRTPTLLALCAGYVSLVAALAWLGASGAYLALVLDLLTAVEVLVALLAVAVGYRSLLGDRESGELATIRTYPIGRGRYVLGVYLGRAVVVVGAVVLGLSAAALLVPLGTGTGLSVIASHATVDSPALYLRYVLLTALFALVALAIAVFVSAAARSTRSGLALATGGALALVAGLDSALLGALLGGYVSPSTLTLLLALSPSSAYRSLVFGLALGPAGVSVPAGPTLAVSGLGLAAWLVGALGLAAWLAWRSVEHHV